MSLIKKIGPAVDPFFPQDEIGGETIAEQRKTLVKEKISDLIMTEGSVPADSLIDIISDIYIDLEKLHVNMNARFNNDAEIVPVVPYGNHEKPQSIVVDMRGDIVGENFYNAEGDGRWTGPGKESVVIFPSLHPGSYEVRIKIVDEIISDLIENTEFSFNTQKLDILVTGTPGCMSVQATTSVLPSHALPFCYIVIRTPAVYSPAVNGLDDKRVLGIRIQQISLNMITGQTS